MKSAKLFLFFVLVIIVCLTSCTAEKRVYMPGYKIDWHNTKQKLEHQVNNSNRKQDRTGAYEQSEMITIIIDSSAAIVESNKACRFDYPDIHTSQNAVSYAKKNTSVNYFVSFMKSGFADLLTKTKNETVKKKSVQKHKKQMFTILNNMFGPNYSETPGIAVVGIGVLIIILCGILGKWGNTFGGLGWGLLAGLGIACFVWLLFFIDYLLHMDGGIGSGGCA
ncbi:MAG: hypothetical protein KKA07_00135 [Bacteroidetes bacterium]|nr:hypothetical protein [Bacteroidota bacterium]MBU1717458.1 hypothetical protein [Bacteroidota bacterium]